MVAAADGHPRFGVPGRACCRRFLTAAFGVVDCTRIGENHRAQMAVGGDAAVIVGVCVVSDARRQLPA